MNRTTCPVFIVLESQMIPPGGMDLFGSGFLPASYQGTLFRKGRHPIADIQPREATSELQLGKLALIRKLNAGVVDRFGEVSDLEATIANYELAFRMQSAVPELLDLSDESERTKKLYGLDENRNRGVRAGVPAGPASGGAGRPVHRMPQSPTAHRPLGPARASGKNATASTPRPPTSPLPPY